MDHERREAEAIDSFTFVSLDHERIDLRDEPFDEPCTEAIDDDARDRRVREAVARVLTPRQRWLIEAHFFEGRSQGEIARALGISEQVVQRLIYGAMRGGKRIGGELARLRSALELEGNDHG